MSKDTLPPVDLLRAFAVNEQLEMAAAYVAAGRRYGRLSDGVLEKIWAGACIGYFVQGQNHRWTHCLDAASELSLRGLLPPMHLIPARTLKRIAVRVRQIARQPEVKRDLQADFQEFMRRRREPAN